MQGIEPNVHDWYRSHGRLFEVVAIDEADGLVEIQHADGDIEEMDLDDWHIRVRAGALATAEAPEDVSQATDIEYEDLHGAGPQAVEELRGMRADAMSDLDLFD
jgi:hypothetical protein